MYFPFGWPRLLQDADEHKSSSSVELSFVRQVLSNRDKIYFAVLTDYSLIIWFCKPCVPVVSHCRTQESIEDMGTNKLVEWRPDSSTLVVVTSGGFLLFYNLDIDIDISSSNGIYQQRDPTHSNLRRKSAELFIKETIPPFVLTLVREVEVAGGTTSLVCIRDELMVATRRSHILRYNWNGTLNRDYSLDLQRVPFCIDQQVAKAVPLEDSLKYVVDIEYSPLVGGFAIVLSDMRAAFLTASSLRFDPNQVQGIWAQNLEDATCCSVNHKYRLITFGRENSQGLVYCVDETTGALQISHQLILSSKDYPGSPGAVSMLRWTPDGRALAMAWAHGGLSLWSTFGTLLMCTLCWDYGRQVDLEKWNPLQICSMDWSVEGYQLWMVTRSPEQQQHSEMCDPELETVVMKLNFTKSALTVNPCMSQLEYLHLQGEDRLYINLSDPMITPETTRKGRRRNSMESPVNSYIPMQRGDLMSLRSGSYMGSKQWIVIPIPHSYMETNWPIRFSAIDPRGHHIAVAGRTGVAHYLLSSRKWKLFGNESQEKDFVVMGGLLWWRDYLLLGCYNLPTERDELRVYSRESKLDNAFMHCTPMLAQVLLMNLLGDKLVVFFANSQVTVFQLSEEKNTASPPTIKVHSLQSIDISALFVHPACVVSVTLSSLRPESFRHSGSEAESVLLNICGRLMMIQQTTMPSEVDENGGMPMYVTPTVLASCVENVWFPRKRSRDKPHLTEALWLYCGAHGMRVWLPLFPKEGDKSHTFMSKRIMLPFHLRIYPLAILFKNAIILGAENDTVMYSADPNTPAMLPFSVLERTSEVYLHQVLRQLIRRNLGFHAWEIARSCTNLPYFPHSLELLLHEVLEEEATSKEPIPDALLPSVVEFIQEFPGAYLQTVVQCARKTEVALWPYLFAVAGKPKDLFLECLQRQRLTTAASYLIILQNLEASNVSRQYATMLLDAALEKCKWELAKDLVRFLKAIDPSDVESPRNSLVFPSKYTPTPPTPPISPNEEDISFVLGSMQVQRARSFSTTTAPKPPISDSHHHREVGRTNSGDTKSTAPSTVPIRKKSVPGSGSGSVSRKDSRSSPNVEWFLDSVLQKHARLLLNLCRLRDLGAFAAHLDFHLVTWLQKERHSVAVIHDFIGTIKKLHDDFLWPHPVPSIPTQNLRESSLSPTDQFHLLTIDVNALPTSGIGDSGYLSQETPTPANHLPNVNHTDNLSASAVEARLMPHAERIGEDASLFSEESSFWGECERDPLLADANSCYDLSVQDLEQVSMEIANRGLPRSEVQLRYLLQMLMEAGCLEWALIISVLLKDAMAVARTINAARSSDQSSDVVIRLRDGIVSLLRWSDKECLGYKPFMMAIQSQITVLGKLLPQKAMLPLHLTTTTRTRTYSGGGRLEDLTEHPSASPTPTVTPLPSPMTLEKKLVDDIKNSSSEIKSTVEPETPLLLNNTTVEQDSKPQHEPNTGSCIIS